MDSLLDLLPGVNAIQEKKEIIGEYYGYTDLSFYCSGCGSWISHPMMEKKIKYCPKCKSKIEKWVTLDDDL